VGRPRRRRPDSPLDPRHHRQPRLGDHGPDRLCVHRLVDRGLLDLEAPVATYWPEFAQAGKADLPVHLLLSHRAGLPAIETPLPTVALYDWTT
jgi:beta-lactamase family protein